MKIGSPDPKKLTETPAVTPRAPAAAGAAPLSATQALQAQRGGAAAAAASPTASSAASGSAQVHWSSAVADTQAPQADMDMDKVQRVKQALASGQYQVNAGAIADQLIRNATDFLDPGSR